MKNGSVKSGKETDGKDSWGLLQIKSPMEPKRNQTHRALKDFSDQFSRTPGVCHCSTRKQVLWKLKRSSDRPPRQRIGSTMASGKPLLLSGLKLEA